MKTKTQHTLRLVATAGLVLILGVSCGCETKHGNTDSGLNILFQVKLRAEYDIYRLRSEGRYPDSVAVLSGDAALPIWSPDRSQFVFSHHRNGHFDLALANADGSNRRYLTADTADDVDIASFFPSGDTIVFSTNHRGNKDIFLIKTDGTGLAPLVTDSSNEWHPVVTPNGKRVIFVSDRTGRPRIWVLDFLSGTQQLVMPPDSLTAEFEPAISPDGRILAFSQAMQGKDGGNFDIVLFDLVDKKATVIVAGPAMDRWPRFSRDGTQILFSSNRTRINALYVYDRRTDSTHALNTGTINSAFGDW